MKTFGERLKFAMNSAGLNQSQLAEKLGVLPQTIGNLCRGGSESSTKNAQLGKILDVDPYWLETGIGEPKPKIMLPEKLEEIRHRIPENQLKTVSKLCEIFAEHPEPSDVITLQNIIYLMSSKYKVSDTNLFVM